MDKNEMDLNVPKHKHIYNCMVENEAVVWECDCGMRLRITLVDYELILND